MRLHAPSTPVPHHPPADRRSWIRKTADPRDHQRCALEALEPRRLLSDDHPNITDFPDATAIAFEYAGGSSARGLGVIETPDDTDVFSFVSPFIGRAAVAAVSSVRGEPDLAPALRILDASGNELARADTNRGVAVILTSSLVLTRGATFYVVVSAGTPDDDATERTGPYMLGVLGEVPPPVYRGGGGGGGGGGSSDDRDDGDDDSGSGGGGSDDGSGNGGDDDSGDDSRFTEAIPLTPDARSGVTGAGGRFDEETARHVYRVEALAEGLLTAQVSTARNDPLRARVTIYNAARVPVASDNRGFAGAVAAAAASTTEGSIYYIEVRPEEGFRRGDYTLQVHATPLTHHLYYPEGFSSPTIEEFIPMINPTGQRVGYTVIAHYETGMRDQIIATGTLGAGERGGVTVTSRREPGATLVRMGEPYALEIRSDGPLGATLSHYDFGLTTGQSFTSEPSTTWSFADGMRDTASRRDFLVFYNPGEAAARLRITLVFEDGERVSFDRTVDPQRRGGVNFDEDGAIPRPGSFGVIVESDRPVVAAMSCYDIGNRRGYGALGDRHAGSTDGFIPALARAEDIDSGLSILNPSDLPVTVRVSGEVANEPSRTFEWFRVIPASTRITVSASELGVPLGTTATLRYAANDDVTVLRREFRYGEGDATPAMTEAARAVLIGDAYVSPTAAGTTYIEQLAIVNPARTVVSATITYQFVDGTSARRTVDVPALGSVIIRVDQEEAIRSRSAPTAFSIRVEAPSPIGASFDHYDLYLGGGWSTLGAPLGLRSLVAEM